MKNLVSLVRLESENTIKDAVINAINLTAFDYEQSVDNVIIKPNLCYYWDASTGYTTDPRVVSGLIDWVRSKFGADIKIQIVEADASGMRTNLAFKILGYEKLAKEKNVELVNLSNVPCDVEKVSVNGQSFEFEIPNMIKKADLFVNVPKMKLMRISRITCAMKNVFGCIATPRKIIYHPNLNEAIVGINKIIKPNLTLVDGIVGLGTRPVKMNLIMASQDVFAIDWIASDIMGFNPSSIGFLDIAIKEKIGYPETIQHVGEIPNKFKQIFPKASVIPTEVLWSLQVGLLKIYTKIVNDVIPPMLQD